MYKKLIGLACFVFVLGMVITSGANAAEPNLVGWWKLDDGSGDTAIDSSGNGNNGTLINDPMWAIGINNGALQFDGIDDYVNCGNDPSLNVTDEVTIAAWVKLNSVPPAFSVLIAGKYSAYWLEWRDTKALSLSMYINGAYNGSGPTLDLADGDWHHIALTYDGTHKKGYHNRQEVFSEGASGSIDVSGVNFFVGEGHPADAGYNGCPDGLIDDVRVYNRALTQEEIQLMMRGKGYPLASNPSPADGALHVDTWASMNWRKGDFAVSHDVYFGDNFDDVNDGTGDTFQGNQDLDSLYFVAGFTGYAYPDGLVPGTTYYWRIDEVNDADPNSPWKGKVWSFWIPSKKAYKPVPSDGGKFIDAENLVLSWTPGFGAALHTVYFGDDFDTVANATDGVSQGITNFNPGPLELEKTYFWRVDEFDDTQGTHTGDIWSFATAKVGGGVRADYYHWNDSSFVGGGGNPGPGQAFTTFVLTRTDPRIDFSWGEGSPDPAINIDVFSARWTGEVEAAFTETYTFYTRTDDGARLWINGQQLVDGWIEQGPTEYSGEIDLVAGNTYSLVMEYYENGVGAVAELRWSSKSTPKQIIPQAALAPPIKANSPSPSNGATDTKMTLILRWGAGDFATSHEVYFGTDANAVTNATKASPEYKDTKALGDENYDPGKLAWFTEYFWRVDEVNNLNPDSPWIGNLWSFTTGDFLVVDDFEDYNVGDNEIWFAWHDGLGAGAQGSPDFVPSNGTGSMIGDDSTGSYTEESIVHGGSQSMPYWYDNNQQSFAKYSEAELTLTVQRDWTEEGVAELSLWFYGDPNNSDEPLYVAVSNSAGMPAVVVHDDPAAAMIDTWTEWIIPLQAFADQGIVLTNVDRIAIGLGTKGNTTIPGGSGKMYFDDIRLYRPREAAE